MKKQVALDSAKDVFQDIIENVITDSPISPTLAVNEALNFFESWEVGELDGDFPDNDMMLFQYGSYNLPNQKEFYLNITRQFQVEEELYQLSLTLYYDLRHFKEVVSFNAWSIAFPTLTDWSQSIRETNGFKIAERNKVGHYEIKLDRI
jgi:hypothetical protein